MDENRSCKVLDDNYNGAIPVLIMGSRMSAVTKTIDLEDETEVVKQTEPIVNGGADDAVQNVGFNAKDCPMEVCIAENEDSLLPFEVDNLSCATSGHVEEDVNKPPIKDTGIRCISPFADKEVSKFLPLEKSETLSASSLENALLPVKDTDGLELLEENGRRHDVLQIEDVDGESPFGVSGEQAFQLIIDADGQDTIFIDDFGEQASFEDSGGQALLQLAEGKNIPLIEDDVQMLLEDVEEETLCHIENADEQKLSGLEDLGAQELDPFEDVKEHIDGIEEKSVSLIEGIEEENVLPTEDIKEQNVPSTKNIEGANVPPIEDIKILQPPDDITRENILRKEPLENFAKQTLSPDIEKISEQNLPEIQDTDSCRLSLLENFEKPSLPLVKNVEKSDRLEDGDQQNSSIVDDCLKRDVTIGGKPSDLENVGIEKLLECKEEGGNLQPCKNVEAEKNDEIESLVICENNLTDEKAEERESSLVADSEGSELIDVEDVEEDDNLVPRAIATQSSPGSLRSKRKRKLLVDGVFVTPSEDEDAKILGISGTTTSPKPKVRRIRKSHIIQPDSTPGTASTLNSFDASAKSSKSNSWSSKKGRLDKQFSPQQGRSATILDPEHKIRFGLPFAYGWRREIVYRSTSIKTHKRMDIYYYPPQGKKLRSLPQINEYLAKKKDLVLRGYNFTFSAGVVSDSPLETIRAAHSRINPTGDSSPSTPLPAKSREDMPVSPPELLLNSDSDTSQNDSLDDEEDSWFNIAQDAGDFSVDLTRSSDEELTTTDVKMNVMTSKAVPSVQRNLGVPRVAVDEGSPRNEKSSNVTEVIDISLDADDCATDLNEPMDTEPGEKYSEDNQRCSHHCPGQVGIMPSLHCSLCLCLFHPACVGVTSNTNMPSYICKACGGGDYHDSNSSSVPTTTSSPVAGPSPLTFSHLLQLCGNLQMASNRQQSPLPTLTMRPSLRLPNSCSPLRKIFVVRAAPLQRPPPPPLQRAPSFDHRQQHLPPEPVPSIFRATPPPLPQLTASPAAQRMSILRNSGAMVVPVTTIASRTAHSPPYPSPQKIHFVIPSQGPNPINILSETLELQPATSKVSSAQLPITCTASVSTALAIQTTTTYARTSDGNIIPIIGFPSAVTNLASGMPVTQSTPKHTAIVPSVTTTFSSSFLLPVTSNSVRPKTLPCYAMAPAPSTLPNKSECSTSLRIQSKVNTDNGLKHTDSQLVRCKVQLRRSMWTQTNERMRPTSNLKDLIVKGLVEYDSKVSSAPCSVYTCSSYTTGNSLSLKKCRISLNKWSKKPNPAACWIGSLHGGYNALQSIFQYLSCKDLFRASQVCRTWQSAILHHDLWKNLSLRRLRILDWEKFADVAQHHSTQNLDLREMWMHEDKNKTWHEFISILPRLSHLKQLHLGEVPAPIVNTTASELTELEYFSAIWIVEGTKDHLNKINHCRISIANFSLLLNLKVLKLRGAYGLHQPNFAISQGLSSLASLRNLTCLSFTSLKDTQPEDFNFLLELHSLTVLELGDCSGWTLETYKIIGELDKLTQLRLEFGGSSSMLGLGYALKNLTSLSRLQLIMFPIASSLKVVMPKLKKLEVMDIWPDFKELASESNYHLLAALKSAPSLKSFTYGLVTSGLTDDVNKLAFTNEKFDYQANCIPLMSVSYEHIQVSVTKLMAMLQSAVSSGRVKVILVPNATYSTISSMLP